MVFTESGDVRTIKAQCRLVAKQFLSVKSMIEVVQFVGFCQQGGFVLDTHTGKVDGFREGNGDYIFGTWLVPHEKSKGFV